MLRLPENETAGLPERRPAERKSRLDEKQKKLKWIRIAAPILYDIALAGLCLYIGLRSQSWLNAMLPFESGYPVFGLLLVYYILNLMTVNKLPFTEHRNLVFAVSTCTFCVIYGTMALIVSDLIQLVIRLLTPDDKILKTVLIVCGFLCLAAVICAAAAGMKHARKIVCVSYESRCDKLEQNRRIVLLTDLHIGYFVGRRHIRRIVRQVSALHPDLVLIAGDLFNGGGTEECTEPSGIAAELAQMESASGTYAVTGNHDPDPSDKSFQAFLRQAGIRLLEDEVCSAAGIQLIGRNTRTKPRRTLKELMEQTDPGRVSVVLDHDPIGIGEARAEQADYVLCGHTHKGQVFPLNLFVRFLYRKDEDWGMTESGSTTSVVSAGAGFFSMPMRVGSDSEVVCIDLKAGR